MRRRRQRRRMCHKQAHRLDGTRYPNTTINCDEEKNDTMRISKTTTVRQASTKWKWTWRNDAIYDVAKCWMQYSLVSLKSSWLSIIIHIRRRDYADTLVSQYIYSLNYNKLTNKSANYYTYEPQPTITPMSHNPHEEVIYTIGIVAVVFVHSYHPPISSFARDYSFLKSPKKWCGCRLRILEKYTTKFTLEYCYWRWICQWMHRTQNNWLRSTIVNFPSK